MKTFIKSLLFLLAVSIGGMGEASADAWLEPWTVSSLSAKDTGYSVTFSEFNGWCTGASGFYVDANSNPHAKELYVNLLSALTLDKKVNVYIVSICQGSEQLIQAVTLVK